MLFKDFAHALLISERFCNLSVLRQARNWISKLLPADRKHYITSLALRHDDTQLIPCRGEIVIRLITQAYLQVHHQISQRFLSDVEIIRIIPYLLFVPSPGAKATKLTTSPLNKSPTLKLSCTLTLSRSIPLMSSLRTTPAHSSAQTPFCSSSPTTKIATLACFTFNLVTRQSTTLPTAGRVFLLETASEGMLKGGGSGTTEIVGGIELEGTLVIDGLVVELREWLVEAEAVLGEGDIMVGRPAMEAYIDDAWR